MKRKVLIVLLVAALSITGCSMFVSEDTVPVSNNSSYTVSMIDIKDADKTEILNLKAGASDNLIYKHNILEGYVISFSYTPANLVSANIDTKSKKVTFTNK